MAGKRRERPGMILYHHHVKQAVERLTAQQLGELLRALYAYANGEEAETEMEEKVSIFFGFMTDAIDRDNERYEETCERKRERAKRQRARAYSAAREESSGCGETQDAPEEEDAEECGLTEVREVRELHAAAANQTEPNQTQNNQTKPNLTQPSQRAPRAQGAYSSACYGRRGDAGAQRRRTSASGGVC